MNTYYNDYVRVRNFSYITSIYNNQVTVGEKYNEDTNIIQINLNYGVKDTEYKRVYKVRDETGQEYIKNFIKQKYECRRYYGYYGFNKGRNRKL